MSKRGILILILTLITFVVWFGLEWYHQRQQSQFTQVSSSVLAPLEPNLDTAVLDKLEQRQNLNLPTPLQH